MKQSTPIRWLEEAEARAICQLAAERGWPRISATRADDDPIATARLPAFFNRVSRRLVPSHRLPTAA